MRSPEMVLRSTRNTVELNALVLGTGNTEKCQRAARKGRGKGKGGAATATGSGRASSADGLP